MSDAAPEGRDEPIPEDEAMARVEALPVDFDADEDDDSYTTIAESDRTLQAVLYTGGSTEYAHIYLAWVEGEYRGNRMLFQRYVWLSKPGAHESDLWGKEGMNIRLVDGMPNPLSQATVAAMQGIIQGRETRAPYFTINTEADEE